jgi:charged multivesicular body protein 6
MQIDLVIENETKIAKKLISEGKKDKALLALKKKKYQEKLLDDLGQQLFNLEEMVFVFDKWRYFALNSIKFRQAL